MTSCGIHGSRDRRWGSKESGGEGSEPTTEPPELSEMPETVPGLEVLFSGCESAYRSLPLR